jgi:4-amino-4-deoxy-L-arabinose transferase-like glycosyltransferase
MQITRITRTHKLDAIFLFLSCMLLFIAGLSTQEITGFDSRFYLFAQEMQRYGMSWFPMTYHQPYPDYPAASTILIYFCSSVFGSLNKLIAVLPTAIMAAMTVALTYLIGSLHNRHWGYCAAVLMLLTNTFFKDARAITLDMYPAMITALCFYLIYSADRENKQRRAVWIYPLLLLGFIFRGPIGLVMPASVVCSYYLLNRDFQKFFVSSFTAFLFFCLCTSALLMLAHHIGGNVFMQNVLQMEMTGRIDDAYLPRYFYFTDSIASYALAFPFALLTAGGIIYYARIKNLFFPHRKLLFQLLGWMLVILIGMSIPDGKKVRYILPVVPALALLAAYPFAAYSSQRYFVVLRKIMSGLLLISPLLFLLLTMLVEYKLNHQTFSIRIDFKITYSLFVLLQAASLSAFYFPNIEKREKFFITIAALGFALANMMVFEPIQIYFDRARDFVFATEKQRIEDKAQLVFYRESPDGLSIKYLLNKTSRDQPVFLKDQQALMNFAGSAYFVMSEEYYKELAAADKFRVIAKDSLGHVRVVVLKKNEVNDA